MWTHQTNDHHYTSGSPPAIAPPTQLISIAELHASTSDALHAYQYQNAYGNTQLITPGVSTGIAHHGQWATAEEVMYSNDSRE